MKILIVGGVNNFAIERHYLKYLRELGANVDIFKAANIFNDYYQKSFINKIVFRSGTSYIYSKINHDLLKKVDNFKPDILFIFKGMELLPKTLKKLKGKGIFLANYNPDHPFIITSKGGGNSNIGNSIALYDLHFCYGVELMNKIKKKYNIKVERLPFGYELSKDNYTKLQSSVTEMNRVCFIGTPDKIRSNAIKHLASEGIGVDVFGNGWKNWINDKNVNTHVGVFDDELWRTLRKYRVQINIFRPHNIGSHNMRSFEIPAVGGIMLAPFSEEHNDFFQNGKEYFSYKNQTDMIEKIKFLLTINESKANEIRINARQRSVVSGYSYFNRSETVFNTFKKYFN